MHPLDAHRLAELRSLAYHRLIAERLPSQAHVLQNAQARCARWLADGPTHPTWALVWQGLLSQPLDQVIVRLGADDEEMRALRQSSPFAGALDPRERWALHRRVREEGGRPRPVRKAAVDLPYLPG